MIHFYDHEPLGTAQILFRMKTIKLLPIDNSTFQVT